MKVILRDILQGNAAITHELGVRVREQIGSDWENEVIELDFSGIRTVTPSFLSNALSPILNNVPIEEIQEKVSLSNLPAGMDFVWDVVIEAAKVRRKQKDK